MKKAFATAISLTSFYWTLIAFAQGTGGGGGTGGGNGTGGNPPAGGISITLTNPLSCKDLQECLGNIFDNLLKLSIPVVAIMVLIGGFQILTAGGNPENVSKGRKTVTYAALGFAIILLARSVVGIINSIFK